MSLHLRHRGQLPKIDLLTKSPSAFCMLVACAAITLLLFTFGKHSPAEIHKSEREQNGSGK